MLGILHCPLARVHLPHLRGNVRLIDKMRDSKTMLCMKTAGDLCINPLVILLYQQGDSYMPFRPLQSWYQKY